MSAGPAFGVTSPPDPRARDAAQVLIVDDEPPARQALRVALSRLPGVRVAAEASGVAEAVRRIRDMDPDIVLLDVRMRDGTGFDVLRSLDPESMPVVIMVTAHDSHAVEAYEHQAIDYLLKPWSDERLERAITSAVGRLTQQTASERASAMAVALAALAATPATAATRYAERVLVHGDESSYFVPVADIDYIESSSNYVMLHVGTRSHRVRMSLRALVEQLDPVRFVRIHRSRVVQVDRIREIQPWFTSDYIAVLRDGRKLRVSRSYRDELLRQVR